MINIYKIISILYIIILTIALLIPLDFLILTSVVKKDIHPSNNLSFLIHLFLFYILYLLFYLSFNNKNKILFFCLIYAILTESFQLFSSRGCQFLDIIFNILGVLGSFTIQKYFLKKHKQTKSNQ